MEETDCRGRIQRIVDDGIYAMVIGLGHQLGIFQAFGSIGRPCTAKELSNQTQLKLRYLEEWLGCMVAGQIVKIEDENYSLLTDAEWIQQQGHMASLLPLFGMKTSVLKECMAKDGPTGYGYETFPEFSVWLDKDRACIGDIGWIEGNISPVIDLIRTKHGPSLNILDIGCGTGRLSLGIGRKYPELTIFGVDEAQDCIEKANALSKEGDYTNVSFLLEKADEMPVKWNEKFDIVIMLDVLHDLADPSKVLKEVKRVMKPEGLFMSFDPLVHSYHGDNSEKDGRCYFFSLFVCLPCSMSREPSAGLGMGWGYEKKIKFLEDSGFKLVSINNENYEEMNFRVVCEKS